MQNADGQIEERSLCRRVGTYHEMAGKDLRYGIDTHPDPHEHSHIGRLLKISLASIVCR